MKRSRFTEEQVIGVLKEGESGIKVAEICRKRGICEQMYYRWKAKYAGLEDLQGHVTVETGVGGTIHLSHAARPERNGDVIMRYRLTDHIYEPRIYGEILVFLGGQVNAEWSPSRNSHSALSTRTRNGRKLTAREGI